MLASTILFEIVLYSAITEATENTRGLHWTLTSYLTNLEYADDVYSITKSHQKRVSEFTYFGSVTATKGGPD